MGVFSLSLHILSALLCRLQVVHVVMRLANVLRPGLDAVDIDGAVDMASTLAVGGVVTANAAVVVDNITIDAYEIYLSSI